MVGLRVGGLRGWERLLMENGPDFHGRQHRGSKRRVSITTVQGYGNATLDDPGQA